MQYFLSLLFVRSAAQIQEIHQREQAPRRKAQTEPTGAVRIRSALHAAHQVMTDTARSADILMSISVGLGKTIRSDCYADMSELPN